jgi:hypothetical protein
MNDYPQGAGPWTPAEPPKKKRKVWPWVLLAVLVLIIGAFVSCTAAVGSAVSTANAPVSLRYEVTGSTSTITYGNAAGMAQETEVSPPWSKEVTWDDGMMATGSVTATLGTKGGKVTCRIYNGDKVVAENSASGLGASASCSGK